MDNHHAVHPGTPSRRLVLGSAAAVAVTALTTPVASARSRRGGHLPNSVALPNGTQPEGVTSGPGATFYVGSVADGRIVTGNLRTGEVRPLLPAAAGRSLRGLFFDRRTGLVWAVGSLGEDGHIWAVDAMSGAVVSDTMVPGAGFLNDLVVTRRAVWATDSGVNRLTVVRLTRHGEPTGAAARFVELTGEWPGSTGAFNANGIRRLPDGALVLNHSTSGGLWQVDRRTGVTRRIEVVGGPPITSGDGLELVGKTLYNVRGNGAFAVVATRMRRRGDEWRAEWVDTLTDPSLDVPSTATAALGSLWVVNARFGVPSPETATFALTRLPQV
ncbi:SMP-30/gluconolactonase/LRE family protein [Terrabacter terrigena]|uniref:Superoxide dismutase n=1 Tax=Terrabacter terrigena TaxID=574718 RepID=A0ABW3N138_9MICO